MTKRTERRRGWMTGGRATGVVGSTYLDDGGRANALSFSYVGSGASVCLLACNVLNLAFLSNV